MKKVNEILGVLSLTMILMFTFSSCKDESQLDFLEDKEGLIFLEGGKYVRATTDFSDESVIDALCSKVWVSKTVYLYQENQIYNISDMEPESYPIYFDKNGLTCRYKDIDYIKNEMGEYRYEVNNKVLKIIQNPLSPLSSLMYQEYYYTVISVDVERIVMDVPYNSKNTFVPRDFVDFDRNKAVVRMVWIPATITTQ